MEPQEKDFLRYEGNHIPRILRLIWTVFFVFAVIYLGLHFWPDLQVWLNK